MLNRKIVTAKTELEFVTEVAEDCIKNMNKNDKEYLLENPCAIEYHFGYAMGIRNHYIHNRDFSEVSFWAEPDHLSTQIMHMILSRLLVEYQYDNYFIYGLYESKGFVRLRKAYKEKFGEYPVDIVIRYRDSVVSDDEFYFPEKEIKACEKEIAELVWDEKGLKIFAKSNGIPVEEIEQKIKALKKIYFKEGVYISMAVCLIPYRKKLDKESYLRCRRLLCDELKQNPKIIEYLEQDYFVDRIIAKAALRYGFCMKYLPMYQNDEAMVKYSFSHSSRAIEYVDQRFVNDREYVKLAIQHSKNDTIMFYDCMKKYRKDKEFVYMACEIEPWNFAYIDSVFQDDFNLAKRTLLKKDINDIYFYLSDRLKDNLELAMIQMERDYFDVEEFSERLRDSEEIADYLLKLVGKEDWAWYHMSERIKEKYGIVLE